MAYQKTERDGAVHFDVQPEELPKGMDWKIPAAVGFLVGFFMAEKGWGFLFGPIVATFFGLFAFGFGGKALRFTPEAKLHRSPSSFSATKDFLEFAGKRTPPSDIQRLVVRNHITEVEQPIIITAQSVGGQIASSGAVSMARQKASLAPIAFRVDFESMGKVTTLAGGLNEATAVGVMQDLSRVLNPKT
jgi:hypothetical protein